MTSQIDHIAIRVADFSTSLKFYEEAFAATSLQTHTDDETIGRVHLIRIGDGACIELFGQGQGQASHGVGAVGITHFAISVGDVDAAYARAMVAGAVSLCPPTDTELAARPGVRVRYAFVFGPNGELFEFINSGWSDPLFRHEEGGDDVDEGSDEDDWPF